MKLGVLAIVVILSACGKSKQEGAGSASGSASGRPASITDEMAATFEAYVVAFEKLTADIEHAGSDCKAVLGVVQRDTKDVIAPLTPRGDKLTAAVAGLKGDPNATQWFAITYTARMKASAEKLQPLETNCAQDAELRAALNDAMSMFPMMRKKS